MSSPLGASPYKRLIFFVCALSVAAWGATPQNRITQEIDTSHLAQIPGNMHPMAQPEFDHGGVDVNQQISGAVAFKLSPAQQANLNTLLVAQQNPSSPQYHKWLTPEQYASRFGLSQSDLAKVTAWLQSQGLTVTRTARGGNSVFFTGTAGQVEYAFHTELHNYLVNGKTHYANASAPAVPDALAGLVLGIEGLNNFRPKSHSTFIRKVRPSPNFTSSVSGNHFLAPEDFATIYDVAGLYDDGFDGTGQKIAVVGQTAINTADMDAFRAASGLAKNDPQLLLVPGSGTSTTCPNDVDEGSLDVEWSGAVAKNASIIFVYTGVDAGATCDNTQQNAFNALDYAVDNNVAPVISTSYGFCEAGLGATFVNMIRGWVQQANTQGQTVVAASGDDGATDCDEGTATAPPTTATQGLAVDTPASIPEVTGIGGSEFSGDVSNPGAFWNATNDSNNGSVKSYIPETSWNDTTEDIAAGAGFSASGGGASVMFSKPSWQTGTGVPADGKRDVPDIALNASADHDGYLLCSQGNCTNGFRDASGNLSIVGGTSVGAPTFSGIVALINQATQVNGQGNINPSLYTVSASTPAAFHDITTGNNKVPCTKGSVDCPNGGTIGFNAGAGYDQVTGLGSVDALQLVTAWPGFTGFLISSNPTNVTVTTGQSASATLTVSGTNSFSGTVALACTSSAASATCTVSPSSVTLDSTTTSATATLNIATTSGSMVGTTSAQAHHPFNWLAGTAGLGIVSIFVLGFPSRRRRNMWMVLCLAAFLSVGIGCGGGSNSTSSNNSSGPITLTVTGTSGSLSRTTTVTVTLQ
jgi:subtilase family serine protease